MYYICTASPKERYLSTEPPLLIAFARNGHGSLLELLWQKPGDSAYRQNIWKKKIAKYRRMHESKLHGEI